MPSRTVSKRRKAIKAIKKMKSTTIPTHHSVPNFQRQGVQGSKKEVDESDRHVLVGEEEVIEGYILSAVSVISESDNKMEEPSNGKIEETQKLDSPEDSGEVQSWVESSVGKLDESKKVESMAEDKEVGTKDGEEIQAVIDSVSEIVIDGNSKSVDDSGLKSSSFDKEEAPDEKCSEEADSGGLEKEKEVSESVTEYVEPVLFPTKDFNQDIEEIVENSIGLETKEKEEKVSLSSHETDGISSVVPSEEVKVTEETNLLSSDGINGSAEIVKNTVSRSIEQTNLLSSDEVNGSSEIVKNTVSKSIEETNLLSPNGTNGSSEIVKSTVSKTIEETNLLSSDEINGSPETVENTATKGIEETTLLNVDGNNGAPRVATDVVSRGIEETKLLASDDSAGNPSCGVNGASQENANDSLQPLDDAPVVDTSNAGEERSNTEIHNSTGNPHIISVSRRPLQPTSWRSCCGLFEFLRRSDK